MDIYNEKINSRLLSGIIINKYINNVKIQDYYDTTDWVGCMGCIGVMHPNHTCEWCDYISKKDPDPHFKTVRFDIDKEQFPTLKDILDSIGDKYWYHNTMRVKEFDIIEKFGLYPTNNFKILKETLIRIGCTMSDMDIIQLNLGNLETAHNVTYDTKLATSRILDLSDAIFEYDVKTRKKQNTCIVKVTIEVSGIDIFNKLRKILEI